MGAKATLIAGAVATLAATFVVGDTQGVASLAQNVIQFGAPVMLGAAVANFVRPPLKEHKGLKLWAGYLPRVLIGGGATAIALIAAGALPPVFDAQTVSLIGLAGGSVAIGDVIAVAIE